MANYMAIKELDINNGPGLRTSFWFSGCHFHCKNCHNKEAWDFKAGTEITEEVLNILVESLKDVFEEKINLSILGGEPLAIENVQDCKNLIYKVREKYGLDKNIWLWTGYTLSELKDIINTLEENEDLLIYNECEYLYNLKYILENINTLIDGRFVESLKIEKEYRGSTNQNIILLK